MWIATPWAVCMMLLLPLLIGQRVVGGRWPLQKARAWLALIGASLLNWAVTPAHGGIPIIQYIAIDTLGALLLLWPPANIHMKRIALLFGVMVWTHVGFAASRLSGLSWGVLVTPTEAHWMLNALLGWVQLAVLAWWGWGDVGRYVRGDFGVGGVGVDRRRVSGIRGH